MNNSSGKKEKDFKKLLESKSGRAGIKIEKEQATLGNVSDYTVTNSNGAQTNIKINNETNAIDIRGEDKNAIQSSLEGSGDIGTKLPSDISHIQQEAIASINNSNISQEEKSKAIADVSSHNFSEGNKKSNEQYLQEVRAKLQEKETKEKDQQDQPKSKESNSMEKALGDLSKNPLVNPLPAAAIREMMSRNSTDKK